MVVEEHNFIICYWLGLYVLKLYIPYLGYVVPDQWKLTRITPIPKVYPPVNVENDLRPIAVTNSTVLQKLLKSLSIVILMSILMSSLMIINLAVFVIVQLHMLY